MPKPPPPAYDREENKIAKTVIIGILYFLLGAVVCLSIFGLGIAYLMS